MKNSIVYIKCRPQQCDAWPIANKYRRVFIGYPVSIDIKSNKKWNDVGCKQVFRDISDPNWQDTWVSAYQRGYRAQVTFNRNILQSIDETSIVLVPRPSSGICYAGRVSSQFELVDRPEWANEYLELRAKQKLDVVNENSHIGDIAQTWSVESWIEIPFPAIPRWISYRLLSRNTIGRIYDLEEDNLSAYDVLNSLLRNTEIQGPIISGNIEQLLIDWLSPNSFEHLIVDLLQLESEAGIYWHHVGGSGDGGVDGMAVDSNGKLKGVLQCKWSYGSNINNLFDQFDETGDDSIVAILHGINQSTFTPCDGRRLLNRKEISRLVLKHKERLPIARTLGLV